MKMWGTRDFRWLISSQVRENPIINHKHKSNTEGTRVVDNFCLCHVGIFWEMQIHFTWNICLVHFHKLKMTMVWKNGDENEWDWWDLSPSKRLREVVDLSIDRNWSTKQKLDKIAPEYFGVIWQCTIQ